MPSWATPAAAAATAATAPSCTGGQAAAASGARDNGGGATAEGVPPAVLPLAGGRAEVYHEVLEAVQGPAEVLLRCHNPYKVSWPCCQPALAAPASYMLCFSSAVFEADC
jgi:hypothetical protein